MTSHSEISIRPITADDLDAVIEIHKTAFPGFFLTRMGADFLRAYYQSVLEFEHSIALIAQRKHTALGFVVGFERPQDFYMAFGQKKRALLPAIVKAVVRNPSLILAILRNRRRVAQETHHDSNAVELSSIAVASEGRGVGRRLLQAFLEQAQTTGCADVSLTTDADDNDAVRQFYERNGFREDGYEDRGPRKMCRYVKSLA